MSEMTDAATAPFVMLIEDDPDHALLIRTGLEESPYVGQVRLMNDGEQALAYLRLGPAAALPALVLLDLKMRKVDGLEVLRAIRALPAWRSVPVVVLTTSAFPADVEASYAGGANSYVTKAENAGGLTAAARQLALRWLGKTSPRREQ